MAQQAIKPQREPSSEPSMDEILASIRRIIEESEPAKPASEPAAIGPAANDPARRATSEAPVMRELAEEQELEMAAGKMTTATAVPEVAADIDMYPLTLDEEELSIRSDMDAAFRELETARGSLEVPAVELDDEDDQDDVPLRGSLGQVLVDAVKSAEVERPKPILSEQVGRQVAASFGDLADAFAASRRRSFDEVAEEMMRPMLQDWLDNNLPVLVERLVREEIERIARGG